MLLALLACTDKVADTADTAATATDTALVDDTGLAADGSVYAFDSAFGDGSSVSYSGQVLRQLLIDDMKAHLGGMTDRLDGGAFYPVAGDVVAELDFYFSFDSSAYGQVPILKEASAPVLQAVYDDVSSGKNLVEKLAGNDPTGQHADWSTELVGWDAAGITTPESLVRSWFDAIDAQAVDWAAGAVPLGPDGTPVPAVFVSPEGLDHQQLLEKFLRGAIAYSQATDDYLDDDLDGKGLNQSHEPPEDGLYTDLEHAWDEAFGYFGAAVTYGGWTDSEIADGDLDVDGDGFIDLSSELCWGHSVNAGKRDLGAVVATDFTAEAWQGFHAGRALLAESAGTPLSDDQLAALSSSRDQAVSAWEKAIAASVVHYINETLADHAAMEGDGYSFADHAKHWSELKGFALSLQFNPRSTLSASEFASLHGLIGTAPALATASAGALDTTTANLREARTLLGEAYGFDSANLGDDDGAGGW